MNLCGHHVRQLRLATVVSRHQGLAQLVYGIVELIYLLRCISGISKVVQYVLKIQIKWKERVVKFLNATWEFLNFALLGHFRILF